MTDADPDGNNTLAQILILLALTGVNAFFAGAEMAIVSVNKNKINMLADDGNKKAQMIQKLIDEPTKFLSTIQVAITLSGFFASASAATGISKTFQSFLEMIHIPYAEKISFVLVTIILSYFTLVFGELVPKRIALQKAEGFSMFTVKPIVAVAKIASPFIKLLTFSTNLFLKILGMKTENLEEEVSKEEIKSLVEQGKENGVFNNIEQEMINSIFEFDNTLAREVMTPRINVFAIDISDPMEEYLDELLEIKYSRIPVYEDEVDNVIGVLYIKDFMREARKKGFENVDIRSILTKPYLIHESKNIDELFREMQQNHKYIAIIIDEYGEFSGIVTIEDLVEEIMGEIHDEYDKCDPKIKKIDEDTYIIDGLVTIDELNHKLNLNIKSEYFDTVSGLLIDYIGRIPKEDERTKIEFDNLVFQLEKVTEKRIDKVRLHIIDTKEIENEESAS